MDRYSLYCEKVIDGIKIDNRRRCNILICKFYHRMSTYMSLTIAKYLSLAPILPLLNRFLNVEILNVTWCIWQMVIPNPSSYAISIQSWKIKRNHHILWMWMFKWNSQVGYKTARQLAVFCIGSDILHIINQHGHFISFTAFSLTTAYYIMKPFLFVNVSCNWIE